MRQCLIFHFCKLHSLHFVPSVFAFFRIMIVPPGETVVGHLHTKESETPGTENEANLEGLEGNLEEGAILEGRTLRKPENRSFEEIGETASQLENPGNIGGSKTGFEEIRAGAAKTKFLQLDEERTDLTSCSSHPITDPADRGEGDGREDFPEEPTLGFEEVSRLLPEGGGCATGGSCEDGSSRTLGEYEGDLNLSASPNLEVPCCATSSRPPSRASQASSKTARPRPNKLLPPSSSPPTPPQPSAGPSPPTHTSKSSYSAVPMAGLPLAGAVCGLCLGGPVVTNLCRFIFQYSPISVLTW